MKKESVGQRGKTAEKIVEAVLKEWNSSSGFAFWRLPDARAAMGRLAAQPGDVCYFCGSNAGIIEIKSTEHDFRLPKDKVSQLPSLLKFEMAGAKSVIVVLHKRIGKWRLLLPSQLDTGVPSWDLRDYVTFDSAEEALKSTGYFQLGE